MQNFFSNLIFNILFLSLITFSAYSQISSTVPSEGGYGRITYDVDYYIEGNFNYDKEFCYNCLYYFGDSESNSYADHQIRGNFEIQGDKSDVWFWVPVGEATFTNSSNISLVGNFIYTDHFQFMGQSVYKNDVFQFQNYISIDDALERTLSYYASAEPDNDYNSNSLNEIIPVASGTGFFISNKGDIVTNYHVVEGCEYSKVFFDGQTFTTILKSKDPINDLALLSSDIKDINYLKISKKDVDLLDDVIAAGFPLGKMVSSSLKTSKGSVTSLSGFSDNFSNFQTDASLNTGNSGGPIIDYYGNVVGVAVAIYGRDIGVEGFNFGIKSSVLRNFLNSNSFSLDDVNQSKLSNKELGKVITDSTVYIECYMKNIDYLNLIEQQQSLKAFYIE